MQGTPVGNLYISHSSHENEFVSELLVLLEQHSALAGRLDSHGQHGDECLWMEIEDALDKTGTFVSLISAAGSQADWVHRELRYALKLQKLRGAAFKVIILSLDATSLGPFETYFDTRPLCSAVNRDHGGIEAAVEVILGTLNVPLAGIDTSLTGPLDVHRSTTDEIQVTAHEVVPSGPEFSLDEPSPSTSEAKDTFGIPQPPSGSSTDTTVSGDNVDSLAVLESQTKPASADGRPKSSDKAAKKQRKTRATRRVFLCYRREDSGPIVGRIYDRLSRDFGERNIFKDVDNIPFGVDFVEHLDGEVQKCDVLFAIIGPRWLTNGPDGQRRLDDPNDFVRIEIVSALRRSIPVVPLLVDGVDMPRAEQLPDDVRLLARRNGIAIRHDPDFHGDITRLLSRLP